MLLRLSLLLVPLLCGATSDATEQTDAADATEQTDAADPAPPELVAAKRAFERAHANYLHAQELCRAMADDLVETGLRMTAVYHEWQAARAAAALVANGGQRAAVFEKLEAGDR